MDDYNEMYIGVRDDLRNKWIAEHRAFDASMVRVKQVWEFLIAIWGTRNTDWGWGVYYAIEKQYGSVPEVITAELVYEGLLKEFNDQPWKEWVERKFREHTS